MSVPVVVDVLPVADVIGVQTHARIYNEVMTQFPEDLYRPEINIPMGTFYYSEVLKEFNLHVPLALAGYNAGPHKIKSFINLREETKSLLTEKKNSWESEIWIDELPWAETTGYVKSILRNTLIYQLIQGSGLVVKPDFWRDLVFLNQ